MATQKKIVVVTRAANGSLRTKEYDDFDNLHHLHEQIGIDDCSTDLSLRGLPLFRGLIGPLTDTKNSIRYESPDVFEALTKEWALTKVKRRRRKKQAEPAKASVIPAPNMNLGASTTSTTPSQI